VNSVIHSGGSRLRELGDQRGQIFLQGARGYGGLLSPSGVQGQSPGLESGG